MSIKGAVMTAPKIYFDAYELSGWHDKINLALSVGEVPCTAFGHTAMGRLSSFRDMVFEHSGFYEADSANVYIDDILNGAFATADKVLSVAPLTGAAGEVAYFTKSMALKYSIGGRIGGMFPFSGAAYGHNVPCVRGTIMQAAAVTASGNSTGRQLGAVADGKYLYAAIHCTATTGSGDRGLTIKVQSDDNASFTSATDRITFTQITTSTGAQWATAVAGPITDDYWRLNFTKAGTTLSATIFGVIGIM